MLEIFEKYKPPGSVGLAKQDLKAALKELGIRMSSNDETELIYTHDLNGDGCIDFTEFQNILSSPGKVELWARNLSLASLLADCMPFGDEEDPLRTLSSLSMMEIESVAEAHRQGLVRLLVGETGKLKRAFEAMDQKMETAVSAQASSKFLVSTMSCGGMADFRGGLSNRIGDPSFDFEDAMEAEHCRRKGSTKIFKTRNYGIETCPRDEWEIVSNNKVSGTTNFDTRVNFPVKRRVRPIQELMRLKQTIDAGLLRAEVIGLVLYTGYVCMFVCTHAYNYKILHVCVHVT